MKEKVSNDTKIPLENKKTDNRSRTYLLGILAIVFLVGLGFLAGIQYEKDHLNSTNTALTNNQATQNGQSGGFGGGRFRGSRPIIGQVTASSASSISIQSQRTGTTTTYAITSSTSITSNGTTVAASSIQTGDTVLVMTSSSSSTTASRIIVNPNFGGNSNTPSSSSNPSSGSNSSI